MHPRPPARRRGPGRVPRAAAQPHLAPEHQHAQHHEHQRQQRRAGRVEAELVRVVDLGGEGAVPQHGEAAVLGQQVQRDDQAAPQQGEARLGQGDPREGAPGAPTEAARRLLQRRVADPQHRGRRQVHERVVRQRHHQHGRSEAVKAREDRDPAGAVDVLGHGDRERQEHRERAAERQVGALDAPRGREPDDHAGGRDRDGQLDAVAPAAPPPGGATAGAGPPTSRRPTPAGG